MQHKSERKEKILVASLKGKKKKKKKNYDEANLIHDLILIGVTYIAQTKNEMLRKVTRH